MVLKALRQQEVGRAKRGLLAQKHHGVVGDRLVERRAQLFPVWNQLAERYGVHDGAREDVRAGLRALFQHHDRNFMAFFFGQLLQADGGGQAGRAAPHHHHVVLHGFARAMLGKNFIIGHVRLVGSLDNEKNRQKVGHRGACAVSVLRPIVFRALRAIERAFYSTQ